MSKWPVAQVRIARPTDQLEAVIRFYNKGVGLPIVGSFEGHAYDGVMLGLPGKGYHLELTSHKDGSPGPAPTEDNLLVLYYPDKAVRDQVAGRLIMMGYPVVAPENSYWEENGRTFADPDGWRVVLYHGEGI